MQQYADIYLLQSHFNYDARNHELKICHLISFQLRTKLGQDGVFFHAVSFAVCGQF